jgi:hypothetical protein
VLKKSAGLFEIFNSFLVFSQMPWRVQSNGNIQTDDPLKTLTIIICVQISNNSFEFLAVMALAESVSTADEALDKNYAIIEDCNAPERTLCTYNNFHYYVFIQLLLTHVK